MTYTTYTTYKTHMTYKTYKTFFNRYLPMALAVGFIVAGLFVYFISRPQAPKAEAGWYATGGTWGYRKQITVDHTKVTGTTTIISNFPMLFSATDTDLKSAGSMVELRVVQ